VTHGCGGVPTSAWATPGLGCEAPIQVLASEIGANEFIVRFVGDVVLAADAAFLWGALI